MKKKDTQTEGLMMPKQDQNISPCRIRVFPIPEKNLAGCVKYFGPELLDIMVVKHWVECQPSLIYSQYFAFNSKW